MKRKEFGRGRVFTLVVGTIAWVALAGLAMSSGCASIVGADDYKVGSGGGGAGGPACGATWAPDEPACEACMEANCCDQLQTCGAGSPCALLLLCGLRNCTSFELPCLQQLCMNELNAAQPSLVALATCHNN